MSNPTVLQTPAPLCDSGDYVPGTNLTYEDSTQFPLPLTYEAVTIGEDMRETQVFATYQEAAKAYNNLFAQGKPALLIAVIGGDNPLCPLYTNAPFTFSPFPEYGMDENLGYGGGGGDSGGDGEGANEGKQINPGVHVPEPQLMTTLAGIQLATEDKLDLISEQYLIRHNLDVDAAIRRIERAAQSLGIERP